MNKVYKSALDKLKLNETEKEKAKALFMQAERGREPERRNRRLWKPVVAALAGLLLFLAASTAFPFLLQQGPGKSSSRADNSFTLTAYAEELTKGGKIHGSKETSFFGLSAQYDQDGHFMDWFTYTIAFPFVCKGENIEKVTYHIENGAFQVINEEGNSIVLSGEPLSEKITDIMFSTPDGQAKQFDGIQPDERFPSMDRKRSYVWEQYHSFTLDYEKQSEKETSIYIVDSTSQWSEEKRNKFKEVVWSQEETQPAEGENWDETLGKHYELVRSPEIDKQIYDWVLQDLGITCTVTYMDGSTETKHIAATTEIMKESDVVPESGSDEMRAVICFGIE